MSWKLYLDDLRNPSTQGPWNVCRNVSQAKLRIFFMGKMPTYISFDHDLGEDEESGYDFAKWLIEQDLEDAFKFPDNFEFNVHSANLVGAKNIREILTSYLIFKSSQK